VYVAEVAWVRAYRPRRGGDEPALEAAPHSALPDYPPDVRGVRVAEQRVKHPVPERFG
jgi:hypothetical protein